MAYANLEQPIDFLPIPDGLTLTINEVDAVVPNAEIKWAWSVIIGGEVLLSSNVSNAWAWFILLKDFFYLTFIFFFSSGEE